MKKLSIISLLLLAGATQAQVIYAPQRTVGDQGISLQGWGSGTISETDEAGNDGPRSLRVSTRNYFQGGIIKLKSPVDMTAATADKSNLLQLSILVANAKDVLGGGGTSGNAGAPRLGGVGGAGGSGGGGAAGSDGPGSGGAAGGRGAGGAGSSGGQTITATDVPLTNVRMIITTSDGLKSEAFLPIRARGKSWVGTAIPLSAINGFERTNKQIVSIAFSGDATATFFVGDIKVAQDTTPIQGDMNFVDPLNLALGDEIEFVGNGYAGATQLRYLWDFDDSDGIQVDVEGQAVKRKFRKAGKYTVTLTIADANGIKAPVVKKVQVTVNP